MMALVWVYVLALPLHQGFHVWLDVIAPNAILGLLAVSLYRRSRMDTMDRRPIVWMAVGLTAWTVGNVLFGLYAWSGNVAPVPSVAGFGHLAGQVCLLVAASLAVWRERGRYEGRLVVDVVLGLLGVAILVSLLMSSALDASLALPNEQLIMIWAHPLVTVVGLALAVIKIVFTRHPDRRLWVFVTLGLGALAVGDAWDALHRMTFSTSFNSGSTAAWMIGWSLVMWGAWQRTHPVPARTRTVYAPVAMFGLGVIIAAGTLIAGAYVLLPMSAVLLASLVMVMVALETALNFRAHIRISQLQQEASVDDLTGIANRRSLFRTLEERLAQSSDQPFLVMMLDLDGFKDINDTFGHDAGDHVLRAVATAISGACRGGDTVARLGGDEFVVISDLRRLDDVQGIAERFSRTVAEVTDLPAGVASLRTSIGVAVARPEDGSDDVVHRADEAMYAQKNAEHRGREARVRRS